MLQEAVTSSSRLTWPVSAVLLAALLLSACVPTLTLTVTPRLVGSVRVVEVPVSQSTDVVVSARGHASFSIPPGHLPPPGQCRIWYPELPPGHQPPPGPCGELRHRVPEGAFLIER